MTKTKYYDLQMDDPQDDYDVEVVNANLKKIDEQMKIRENATDTLQEPEFTVADKRENIVSKEKMQKILGKIAKFFTDLKKVAFTGDYADLTNKPTYGKGFITDKSGSITINLDGETITLDQAKNVIKLADTLKEKINGAFPAANLINNLTTTEAGFGLDARQGKALDDKITEINGSLKNDINALNPSAGIKVYTDFSLGRLGVGWYRFAEIIFNSEVGAEGAGSNFIEILINQIWNKQVGCFHKIKIILIHMDKAKISSSGIGTHNLTNVRVVRKSNILYFDVFSRGYDNGTYTLLNIPMNNTIIISAKAYSNVKIVPETADGEVIVCSIDLADNI